MAAFAEVRFKGTRKGYFAYEALDLVPGDPVIVEADRGEDLGEITALGSIAERKCATSGGCATPLPEMRVLRVAREADCVRVEELRADEPKPLREQGTQSAHGMKPAVGESSLWIGRHFLPNPCFDRCRELIVGRVVILDSLDDGCEGPAGAENPAHFREDCLQ